MAEGAQVKTACHPYREVNKSQARQVHHGVPRGKEAGDRTLPLGSRGAKGAREATLRPAGGSGMDGDLMELPGDPKSQ